MARNMIIQLQEMQKEVHNMNKPLIVTRDKLYQLLRRAANTLKEKDRTINRLNKTIDDLIIFYETAGTGEGK